MDENVMFLEQLASLTRTDKLEHGYISFYEKHLPPRDAKIKLLEIGVKQGRSIEMWLDYFPNAEIHGLDLFVEHPIPFQHPRAHWYIGNQCDWQLLEQLRHQNFDVIIDDGSHNSRDQMISFFGLMHDKCSYFIEDLHCCREFFYNQGLPYQATAQVLLQDSRFLKVETGVGNKIMLIQY